jgi:hypothetical protein
VAECGTNAGGNLGVAAPGGFDLDVGGFDIQWCTARPQCFETERGIGTSKQWPVLIVGVQARNQRFGWGIEPNNQGMLAQECAVILAENGTCTSGDNAVGAGEGEAQRFGFEIAKVLLAIFGENERNTPTSALFDQLINIDQFPTKLCGKCPANTGFTSPAQANQRDNLRLWACV